MVIPRHLFAMTTVAQPLFRFLSARLPGRKGQTLVEYSLILAMIAIACIAAFGALGKQVTTIFSMIVTLLDTAQGSH